MEGEKIQLNPNLSAGGTLRLSEFSHDGKTLAVMNESTTTLSFYNMETSQVFSKIENVKATILAFSPLDNYIVTWQRPPPPKETAKTENQHQTTQIQEKPSEQNSTSITTSVTEENESDLDKNLIVWDIKSATAVAKFQQKNFFQETWFVCLFICLFVCLFVCLNPI